MRKRGWEKTEETLNQLLEKLGVVLKKVIGSITPGKVKSTTKKLKLKAELKKTEYKAKLQTSIKGLPQKLKKKKEQVTVISGNVTKKAGEISQKVKTVKSSDFNPLKIITALIAFIAPLGVKIQNWYLALKPTTFLAIITTSTVGSLATFQVYTSSQQMIEEAESRNRQPASQIEDGNSPARRPAYFNKTKKQLLIANITLPVYVASVKGMRSLILDIKVESSNRYIREYFYRREHLLKDRLNTKIHPTIPSFPLEREGTDIIKSKIQKELNILIKELGIDGQIEHVYIMHKIGA